MGQVTITIDKREYAITCDDGEEAHIIKLSRILDAKAKLLSQSIGSVNENMMLAMVGLLLADENQDLRTKNGGVSDDEIRHLDTATAQAIDSESQRINSLIQSIEPLWFYYWKSVFSAWKRAVFTIILLYKERLSDASSPHVFPANIII